MKNKKNKKILLLKQRNVEKLLEAGFVPAEPIMVEMEKTKNLIPYFPIMVDKKKIKEWCIKVFVPNTYKDETIFDVLNKKHKKIEKKMDKLVKQFKK